VGSSKTMKVDIRLVAATNRDLAQAIKQGLFREDLYYRIRVIPIELPPLRERKEDIPLLIRYFIEKFNREMPRQVSQTSPDALEALEAYTYPGNVRELQNIIEHAFVCGEGQTIELEHLPTEIQRTKPPKTGDELKRKSLKRVEGEAILRVLERTGWKYKMASEQLGIGRSTLWRKIKRLGLVLPTNVSK